MNLSTPALVVAVLLATPQILPASETREIAGRDYFQDGQRWYHRDAGGREYRVHPDVITIKLRQDVDLAAEQELHERLGGKELRRALTGFIDVEIGYGQDVFEAIDGYMASGMVEIAEPNTFGEYHIIPNDPSYGSQWHPPVVDAEEAWDTTAGSTSVIVAVLDSGTEFTHEDLGTGSDGYQNIWLNNGEDAWSDPDDPATGNGVDDDLNGYVDDWKGFDFAANNNNGAGSFFHGTAVAGVTAAKTNNGTGIAGIAGGFGAAGTLIMVAGVGDTAPNGSILDDAILYAAAEGASVVQLSLTVGQSAAIDAALQMAYDDFDVTIICSSGNGGVSSVGYPSSDSHVIAVGSTTETDFRSSFSNHGPDVEVSAPGSNIFTLDLNDGYLTTSGTSFSSPLTSGVVALVLAVNPALTNVEVRQLLWDTADKVGGYDYNWNGAMPGHSFELGYGRVNAHAAVLAANAGGIFADGFESGNTLAWSSTNR